MDRISRTPPAKLRAWLRAVRGQAVIITFHSMADMDAAACAYALAEMIGRNAQIAHQDTLNAGAKKALAQAGVRSVAFSQALKRFPDAEIAVVDCSDPRMLPALGDRRVDAIIDHHALNDGSLRAPVMWVDPGAPSASQMVAALLPKPSSDAARLLAMGIISDSALLRVADARAFEQLARLLLRCGCGYDELVADLTPEKRPEVRAAVLQALTQAAVLHRDGRICAITRTDNSPAAVASALVDAGADCAFCAAKTESGCIVSARMRKEWAARVDLAALMNEVGAFLGGSGSGHPEAAAATGIYPDRIPQALELARDLFFGSR